MLHPFLALTLPIWLSSAQAGWAPVVTDQRLYSAAITDLAGGRLEEAATEFTAILAKDPTCGMALHGRGVSRLRLGMYTDAAVDLAEVVAQYPERSEGHTALSSLRFAQQDFPAALASARSAVEADPGDIDANAVLQQVLLRLGELDAARSALTAASDDLPPSILACFEVQIGTEAGDSATVEASSAQCRVSGVPGLVAAALSRASGDVAIVGEMAGHLGVDDLLVHAQAVDLFNDGAYAEAVATLDPMLARSPHRVDARLLRARARYAVGDAAGALADLEAAFDAPTWVDVHRSGAMSGILRKSDEAALSAGVVAGAGLLVRIHLDAGELDAARDRLEQFEASLGAHASLQAARADWMLRSGDGAGAWASLTEALQASPRDPHLIRLASSWAVAMPESVPSEVSTLLSASGSWQDAWNLAVSQRKGGDVASCQATAAAALSTSAVTAPPDVQRRLAGLAHRCAVAARDRVGADAMVRPAGGLVELDPVVTYNHAHLRFEHGDARGALALLDHQLAVVDTAQPDAARAMVALAIRAHLDVDALEAAHDLARGAWATPEDQLVVASRLAVANDDGRAMTLLEQACPALSGDVRDRCDTLVGVLTAAEE